MQHPWPWTYQVFTLMGCMSKYKQCTFRSWTGICPLSFRAISLDQLHVEINTRISTTQKMAINSWISKVLLYETRHLNTNQFSSNTMQTWNFTRIFQILPNIWTTVSRSLCCVANVTAVHNKDASETSKEDSSRATKYVEVIFVLKLNLLSFNSYESTQTHFVAPIEEGQWRE